MIIEMLGKNIVAYDSTKLAGDICVKLGADVPSFSSGTIGLETIIEENPDVLFVVKSGGNPEEAADFSVSMLACNHLRLFVKARYMVYP